MKYFLSFQKSLKKQNLTFQNQWTSTNPREFGKHFSKNQSRTQDVNLEIMEGYFVLKFENFLKTKIQVNIPVINSGTA